MADNTSPIRSRATVSGSGQAMKCSTSSNSSPISHQPSAVSDSMICSVLACRCAAIAVPIAANYHAAASGDRSCLAAVSSGNKALLGGV
jgi:hypothetical protein